MQTSTILEYAAFYRRRDEASGGGMGLFIVLLIVGIVIFLVLRGRRDRQEQLGASHRPMGTGPVEGVSFACPYPKCPSCGAAADKMRHQYDGLRKVTWTCGYCGTVAGVQELRDEELPAGARARLGLDVPQGMVPGQPGYYPPQGPGMGGLITGMMIGSMLGGGHERDRDGWGGGSEGRGDDWGNGGGESGGSGGDWGDSGGGDWGDSGGGDSGGGDF